MHLSLREAAGGYAAGTTTADSGIQRDRSRAQLLELADTLTGKIAGPTSFDHGFPVQVVVLAAAGYVEWREGVTTCAQC